MHPSIKIGTRLEISDDSILLHEHSCFTISAIAPTSGTSARSPRRMNATQSIVLVLKYMHAYITTIYPAPLSRVFVASELMSFLSSGAAPMPRIVISSHASPTTIPTVIIDILTPCSLF